MDYQGAFPIWGVLSLLCGTLAGILVGVSLEGVGDNVADGLVWAVLLLACVPVMLLMSPFGWAYYLPFLLIPFPIL